MTTTLLIVGMILIVLIILWIIFNTLVRAKNIVNEAFSGIDVQLKKRFELIPNLIEAVKGYNSHEAETLEKIVQERSNKTDSIEETATIDRSITQSLKAFRIQIEAYPTLKANTQFLKLMDKLSEVENELAMSRRYYNGATRDYNSKIQVFPGFLVAKLVGYNAFPFYEIEDDQERNLSPIELSKND